MELKKLAPWNWFKKEDEVDHVVPVKHGREPSLHAEGSYSPMLQMHRDIDRLFDRFFRGFGPGYEWPAFPTWEGGGILKPRVDLSATDKDYLLTVEIPGVDEKDVSVDVSSGIMTIKGEKKQEHENKEAGYYRVERRYGSFQRLLSLPEDVDQEGIKASFKNGVLSISMPRKALPQSEVKQIRINA